jgi:hypothetical protein
MMPVLKQAGMIVVLVLLSEGMFVSYRALAHTDEGRNPERAAVKFVGGAILCSSALMLLYSLGTRDEEWNENAHGETWNESGRTRLSRWIHFRREAGRGVAPDQGVERLYVWLSTRRLGEPVERLGSAAEPLSEFVFMHGACARTGIDEVKRFRTAHRAATSLRKIP